MNERLIILAAGLVAAAWAFRRWRDAIKAVMVLLVVEGAIRKWLFPGAQDLVYFGKDVLLLAAYGGFLRDRERLPRIPSPPAPLLATLALGAAFGALQIFNPRLPNLLVGLLGFKAYFLYVPLVWVLPRVFDSDADLARFLRRYVLLAIPVGGLAVAQFFSPASSWLNTYARGGEAVTISTFGTSRFVRVTGTFSYITGFTSYLLATAILALAILATTRWRWRGQLPVYAALAATLVGMLMSGSRGPVFLFALILPIYAVLAVARERGGGATFGRLLVGAALVAALVVQLAPEAVEAFLGRASSGRDVRGRAAAPFTAPVHALQHAGLVGFGIGATHQAATIVAKGVVPFSWTRGIVVEAESGKVMLELGPIGFALVYGARLLLAGWALSLVLRLKTRFHRALATSALLLLAAQMVGTVVFDPTTGVFYWTFAGLLVLAARLDREAEARARATVRAAAPEGPALAPGAALRRHAAPQPLNPVR